MTKIEWITSLIMSVDNSTDIYVDKWEGFSSSSLGGEEGTPRIRISYENKRWSISIDYKEDKEITVSAMKALQNEMFKRKEELEKKELDVLYMSNGVSI